MQILAHRTAMANAPPNSLEGLKLCCARGINIVECDLSFTRDKQPTIWHDQDNYLLEHSKFSIKDLTLEEAKKLKRRDCNEVLLTLDDVWYFLKSHPAVQILFDIKYYINDIRGVVQPPSQHFINLAREHIIGPAVRMGLIQQVGLVAFEGGRELLRSSKEINGDIFTSLIVVRPWLKISDDLRYIDAVTVGWGWRGLNHWWLCPETTEQLVCQAKNSGRKIWGGLASKESHVEWLTYHGFDGIWADDLDTVREVLISEI